MKPLRKHDGYHAFLLSVWWRLLVAVVTAEPYYLFTCLRQVLVEGKKCFRKCNFMLTCAETHGNVPETWFFFISVDVIRQNVDGNIRLHFGNSLFSCLCCSSQTNRGRKHLWGLSSKFSDYIFLSILPQRQQDRKTTTSGRVQTPFSYSCLLSADYLLSTKFVSIASAWIKLSRSPRQNLQKVLKVFTFGKNYQMQVEIANSQH